MKVEYCKKGGALYIYLLDPNPTSHSHTEEWIKDTVLADMTSDGQVSGIEVIGVTELEVKDES